MTIARASILPVTFCLMAIGPLRSQSVDAKFSYNFQANCSLGCLQPVIEMYSKGPLPVHDYKPWFLNNTQLVVDNTVSAEKVALNIIDTPYSGSTGDSQVPQANANLSYQVLIVWTGLGPAPPVAGVPLVTTLKASAGCTQTGAYSISEGTSGVIITGATVPVSLNAVCSEFFTTTGNPTPIPGQTSPGPGSLLVPFNGGTCAVNGQPPYPCGGLSVTLNAVASGHQNFLPSAPGGFTVQAEADAVFKIDPSFTYASGYSLEYSPNLFAGSQGPAASAVSPTSGSGSSQNFSVTFTNDPVGAQQLGVVNILINNFLDGRQACYIAYSVPDGKLYLVDDAGDAGGPFAGTIQLNGSLGSISNGQCMINGAGSSAAISGDTLTLTLNITFTAPFAGNKIVYTAARDRGSGNSGWQALGVWSVPGFNTFPSVGTVIPSSGTGLSQTFILTFADSKGSQDLGVVNILINNFLDGRQACYLAYSQPLGVLYLENDAGTALLPAITLGRPGSTSNSACTVNAATSSASVSGNILTLKLDMSFTAAFAGNRVIYAAARDSTDSNNSGWQSMGSWTVVQFQ
jgi:hypothetical protein